MGRSHENLEDKAKKTLSVLKENLNTVRAGRANPALLDKINVDYYGVPTPLKNMTNISVPDPRTLLIVPFDPKTIGEVERAINEANIGINPTNDGKNIRLIMPPLTEDRRKELAKSTKKMGEEAKIAVRNARREADKDAKKSQKDGDISEDELTIELENIQKVTDKAIKDIDAMIAEKDKEIMEI